MKRFISAATVIALLAAGTIDAQAASKKASENATTAQLNQQQLQLNGDAQEAAAPPSRQAPMPMPQAGQAGTYVNGKYVPPGARCGADNPNCAQQLNNPAVNSATQLRLQGAQ